MTFFEITQSIFNRWSVEAAIMKEEKERAERYAEGAERMYDEARSNMIFWERKMKEARQREGK